MNGYMGKILRVDLSQGRIWEEPLNEEYARLFVGGSGLAARYLLDMVGPQTDPLGPENPLIFMTGPLVGTAMPSAGRLSVCALSPLTRIWGESNTGGFVGPELRFAGYDGIIVTGRADRPVWLSVVEGDVRLHDAADLWGLDSYTTQERVRELLGEPKARVLCIGPAGERQVKMAAVMNDHGRAAGRTGMGAVMGSKNLKAIALRGTAQVPLADPERFKEVVREVHAATSEDMAAEALRLAGTAGYVDMALMFGDLPIRHWRQGEWEEAGNLSGVVMADRYLNRPMACYRCPIACGRETRAPRYGLEKVDGPEYETVGALGTMVMVSDLEAVIYAGHLCNVYGLDTISTGCTIALACELFEEGIITPADTGGLEIRFGDAETIHRLISMMAFREGFGDVLAEGSAALAERFGVPERAVVVNRLEVPMHDPRAFVGMAVTYALSPRGACHMQGDMYGVDTGQGPATELGILPGDRFEMTEEKGHIAARQQAWRNLYNSMILCQFQNPGVERVLAALNAVTGWGLAPEDLLEAGKRIVTLKRVLNMRRGVSRADDRLPVPLLVPLESGGAAGVVPDLEVMLAGAYAEFGWDPQTGAPTEAALAAAGLI
ncbi:MAG: aldehyde ferredoxin oxidoreductase family protein [Anaerolineae bacterium]|nr:aldehyde ferredoxin oxidoreductase family protein [Anaerolineae bacterium]